MSNGFNFYLIQIKKEAKEFWRNPQTLVLLFTVVILNFTLNIAFGKGALELSVSLPMLMLGFYVPSFMIVEEQEKKTILALKLTPAPLFAICFGKASFVIMLTSIFCLFVSLAQHFNEIWLLNSIIGILLGSILVSNLGLVVGLLCRKQSEVSAWGTIIFLILFIPELMASFSPAFSYIARALPLHYIFILMRKPLLSFESIHALIFLVLSNFLMFIIYLQLLKKDFLQMTLTRRRRIKVLLIVLIYLALSGACSIFTRNEKGRVVRINDCLYYQMDDYKLALPISNSKLDIEQWTVLGRREVVFKLGKDEHSRLLVGIDNSGGLKNSHQLTKELQEQIQRNKYLFHEIKEEIIKEKKVVVFSAKTDLGESISYSFIYKDYNLIIKMSTNSSKPIDKADPLFQESQYILENLD